MSAYEDRERRARIAAADQRAPKCNKGHAICGDNIYRDPSTGIPSCWLCRIESARSRTRAPAPSRRRARTPLSPDVVRRYRELAGMDENDETEG